jgi:threonine/homoserine/homoserine lactone efflux protein
MEMTLWLSFVGTVLILVITPGPSVLLATANSMKYGKIKTLGTIA